MQVGDVVLWDDQFGELIRVLRREELVREHQPPTQLAGDKARKPRLRSPSDMQRKAAAQRPFQILTQPCMLL